MKRSVLGAKSFCGQPTSSYLCRTVAMIDVRVLRTPSGIMLARTRSSTTPFPSTRPHIIKCTVLVDNAIAALLLPSSIPLFTTRCMSGEGPCEYNPRGHRRNNDVSSSMICIDWTFSPIVRACNCIFQLRFCQVQHLWLGVHRGLNMITG